MIRRNGIKRSGRGLEARNRVEAGRKLGRGSRGNFRSYYYGIGAAGYIDWGPVLEISLANKRRTDRRNTRNVPGYLYYVLLSHLDGPTIIKRGGSNPRFKFRLGRATSDADEIVSLL